MRQVHGARVLEIDRPGAGLGEAADAAVCRRAGGGAGRAHGRLRPGRAAQRRGSDRRRPRRMAGPGRRRHRGGRRGHARPRRHRDRRRPRAVHPPGVLPLRRRRPRRRRRPPGSESCEPSCPSGGEALDLPAAVRTSLERSGAEVLGEAGVCTACSPAYWSWRGGRDRQRQATGGVAAMTVGPRPARNRPRLGPSRVRRRSHPARNRGRASPLQRWRPAWPRFAAASPAPEGIRQVVKVVAVTKGFGPEAVVAATGAGLWDIGENYAQELLAKASQAPEGVRWHFLGPVQRNKVAGLAPHVALWQGLDRPAAGEAIARRSPGARVLVQVNVSGEASEGGMPARGCGRPARRAAPDAPRGRRAHGGRRRRDARGGPGRLPSLLASLARRTGASGAVDGNERRPRSRRRRRGDDGPDRSLPVRSAAGNAAPATISSFMGGD